MEAIQEMICPKELIEERPGRDYRNIDTITYLSKVTGTERKANVVFPKDYSADKRYPVLYLLHGFFGNEGTMLKEEDAKIPEILGNMAEDGLAREVIAVFPNIYVTADPNLAPGFSVESIAPYDLFLEELVSSLGPYMEEHYPLLPGRENRALFGFSFGGKEAIYMSMLRPDLFGFICSCAPAPGLIPASDWAMTHPGMFSPEELRYKDSNSLPELFILCRGSKDSTVGTFPVDYHVVLEQNGVEHLWYEAPGLEHGEPIVQSGVYNLMLRWKEPNA